MSKFLKLKQENGRVLIAVNSIVAVQELGEGCLVETKDSEFIVKEGYQTLVNRLTKDDAAE